MKAGSLSEVIASGRFRTVVSGAAVSTTKLEVAGLESVLMASVALTANSWGPWEEQA